MWSIALREGTLELRATGTPRVGLPELAPEVVYEGPGGWQTWGGRAAGERVTEGEREGIGEGEGRLFSWEAEPFSASLELSPGEKGLVVRFRVRNTSPRPVRVRSFRALRCSEAPGFVFGSGRDRLRAFVNGYQSWSGTRSYGFEEMQLEPRTSLFRLVHCDPRAPRPRSAGEFHSSLFFGLKNLRSGEALVCGFLGESRAFGRISFRLDEKGRATFRVEQDHDDVLLEPGEEFLGDDLWLGVGFDETELLVDYAEATAGRMRARRPSHVPVGWCSWYHEFTRVREESVLENARSLVRLRRRFPCEYVQVDDGYQRALGDWLEPNGKFPSGLQELARTLREMGFDPGIWTAPFLAERRSRLYREHPDWFVRDRRGRPRVAVWNPAWSWFGFAYALDTTHPEVLAWLEQTFRTLAQEWGYRVLKLDFLYAAALPGLRHDPKATRAEALRRGLWAVRKGAGEEAFLLGCGCPLGPAIGIVDGMRIGPDVAPFWSGWMGRVLGRDLHGLGTKNALRNTLSRWFLHGRWWLDDPDCLLVRDVDTRLGEEEVRALVSAVGLSGGMVVWSDRVEKVSPERVRVLETVFRMHGRPLRVADLFESDPPSVILAERQGKKLLGLFNFSDRTREITLDVDVVGVEEGEALELWTGRRISLGRSPVFSVEVPPHGCRVLELPGVAGGGNDLSV
ncbi:MAG: hypothetical protein KatS3mg076_2163 [Candidatus Binatia bacterium]|nr:MAG: hypothetical protein KatS3mg076_2163 [Candidatus Binatia bacterium]